jgi:hypothetical protein
MVLSTADLRTINRTEYSSGNPAYITCAEPSPDVAKIASASFSGDLAASAQSAGPIQNPELALSLALARTESLAQLGQRLATIQLLRDGLFRACEAYANKAISEETYALILSRYDDVMITMLLAEFGAASTTGGPLARLTGGATSSGIAFTGPGQGSEAATKALGDAQTARNTKAGEVQQAEAAAKAAPNDADAAKDLSDRKAELAALDKDVEDKKKLVAAAREAAANSFATVVASAVDSKGATAGQSDQKAIAAAMVAMQRAYLDDFNLDGLMVSCLSTMTKDATGTTQNKLAEACGDFKDKIDVLTHLEGVNLVLRADGPQGFAQAVKKYQEILTMLETWDTEIKKKK